MLLLFVQKWGAEIVFYNLKGFVMKKMLFTVLLACVCGGAVASDYTYTETETITTWESVNYAAPCDGGCDCRYASSRDVRPCVARRAAVSHQPVRVKTHTEVIDHYQVYQPITVYKPMGTEIQRRVVPAKSCKTCGM